MADVVGVEVDMGDYKLELLSIDESEEYTRFLMHAYKDQFNSGMFRDSGQVRKRWLWEYCDGPQSDKDRPLIWIMKAGGMMAGQICVMPVTLQAFGKRIRAGWCQDFIVLPEFRKKGIGQAIVREMTSLAQSYVDILLAVVASEASYRVFGKSSYIDAGFMRKSLIISDPKAVSERVIGNRFLRLPFRIFSSIAFGASGLRMRPVPADPVVAEFDGDIAAIGAFLSKVDAGPAFRIYRDASFFKWRFVDQPGSAYNVLTARTRSSVIGYIVFRTTRMSGGAFKGLDVGIISDLQYRPDDPGTAAALLNSAAIRIGNDVDIIKFDHVSPQLDKIALRAGFINIGSRNRLYLYPFADILAGIGPSDLKKALYITSCDSDLDLF